MLTEKQRKRVFNIIIVNQCLGMLSGILFQNGFYLNYFSKLGISSASIALLFALPPLVSVFLLLPFAFVADRMGKKRLALSGQVLLVLSLVLMLSAGWGNSEFSITLVVVALLISSIGGSLQGASWFALLNPIVPKEIRGRFFGRLRVTFMSVTILFTLLVTYVLKMNKSMSAFQWLLALVLLAAILRYFTYARIPELENKNGEEDHRASLKKAFSAVIAVPGYLHFSSYVFLITLFTAGVPIVFGLMQKDVFGFGPAQITQMGNLFLIGTLIGCGLGGRTVDRYGTRVVFVATHIGYFLVILSLLIRSWVPWSLPIHVGSCSLAFSLVGATAGVAITSEVMALIPATNKSLFTAVFMMLISLAVALSNIVVSRSISLEILAPEWTMLGQTYTAYDALLLAFAAMTLLLLVTVGLVPKIAKKTQLMPGGGSYPRI